jgi:hypothetical protein
VQREIFTFFVDQPDHVFEVHSIPSYFPGVDGEWVRLKGYGKHPSSRLHVIAPPSCKSQRVFWQIVCAAKRGRWSRPSSRGPAITTSRGCTTYGTSTSNAPLRSRASTARSSPMPSSTPSSSTGTLLSSHAQAQFASYLGVTNAGVVGQAAILDTWGTWARHSSRSKSSFRLTSVRRRRSSASTSVSPRSASLLRPQIVSRKKLM